MTTPRKPAAKRLAYYPWFPGDFLSDPRVVLMDHVVENSYRRLLDFSWKLGESGGDIGLQDDDAVLGIYCKLSADAFRTVVRPVLIDGPDPVFHRRHDGRLLNKKLHDLFEHAVGLSQVRRHSANRRWEKLIKKPAPCDDQVGDAIAYANAMQNGYKRSGYGVGLISSSSTRKRTRRVASRRVPSDFEFTPKRSQFGQDQGLTVEGTTLEWAKFGDHEFQNARSDWDAAWRNWVRRAVHEYRSNGKRTQGVADYLRDLDARAAARAQKGKA